MAFFKFRKGSGADAAPAPTASESVQALRQRARHRLIGATVLVLIGVIGFPLVFDNQPRPIAVDIPIEIPDKNKVKPLSAGAMDANPAPSSSVVVEDAVATAPKEEVLNAKPDPGPQAASTVTKPPAPEPAKAPAKESAKEPTKESAKEPPKAHAETLKPAAPAARELPREPKPSATAQAEAAKAQALLEGREPEPTAPAVAATDASSAVAASPAKGRFVVQVGSYTDAAKAREARMKLERAGLKTYIQEVTLKDGKRLRVRVGPFDNKAQAEKAAAKAKSLELSGAILEL